MSLRLRAALFVVLAAMGCAPADATREAEAARPSPPHDEAPPPDDATPRETSTFSTPIGGGALDTSFDASSVELSLVPMALTVAADGALFVGGGRTLVRLDASGALDRSFGDGGVLVDASLSAADIAVQPDGKLVVAGTEPNATAGSKGVVLSVVRLLPSGAHDATFGDGGKVVVGDEHLSNGDGSARVIVQPDGRIVVAAAFFPSATVARLEANGALDPFFGDAGTLSPSGFGGVAMDASARMAIAQRGSIERLAADGSSTLLSNGDDLVYALPTASAKGAILATCQRSGETTSGLCRFSPSGAPDVRVSLRYRVKALALLPDGHALGLGSNGVADALVRFDERGAADASFGTGGSVVVEGVTRRLAVMNDGRAVVAGTDVSGKELRVARFLP